MRLQLSALEGFRELGADDYVRESLVRMVEIHVLEGEAAAAAALEAAAAGPAGAGGNGEVPVLPGNAVTFGGPCQETLRRHPGRTHLARGRARTRRRDGFDYEVALASLAIARMDEDDDGVAGALANRDGFDYEVALASLAIAKMDEDDDGVAEALAKLSALGVLTPPPGS